MSTHVTSFISEIEKLRKALNALGGGQVHSAKTRGELRALAERYFADIRPSLIDHSDDQIHIAAVNSAMQSLVEICHKRGVSASYIDLLRNAKGHLIHLDSALISSGHQQSGAQQERTPTDIRIITTLRALVPSAALSYEQALQDLTQPERLSWRGPATDLREALRETLDRLAPDDEVKATPGYKDEPDARGPTMKQKVRFILRNRQASKALAATTEDATKSVDEAIGSFVRSVYTRSSVSTHTPTEKGEVLRVLDLVRVVLSELLEVR
ncbi:hypothetical protein [Thermomonas carbonis]|uniref:Predicted pPIWI-associating nuclease domain-containing protein n=1 Tax=Thermomonas carbonis TaxID=1463158 RepID=A0A7G9SPN0_9GAMM|nr:hypothetical protein [Thermomonas carbonis]QNN69805.1 hypothetical protein H9L16_14320 [Thermomonas carbonis]GHB95624.1 hypothetical protein GCM10010080_04000 [Thermomonas carbonis]